MSPGSTRVPTGVPPRKEPSTSSRSGLISVMKLGASSPLLLHADQPVTDTVTVAPGVAGFGVNVTAGSAAAGDTRIAGDTSASAETRAAAVTVRGRTELRMGDAPGQGGDERKRR